MGRTPESFITRGIMAKLEKLRPHAFFFKVHGGPMQRAGIPDILGCYKGRLVGFEVKVPGGKVRPLQSHLIDLIRAAGGVAEVVYCWADCKKIIEKLDGAP